MSRPPHALRTARARRASRDRREQREQLELARDRRRVSGVAVGVVIALVVLSARVAFVAIVQHAHWRAAAAAQSQTRVILDADRGSITDRNGVDLATDVAEDDVVVDPQQVDNVDYYAKAMAPVLGIDEATLRHRMRKERLPNKHWLRYRVIATNIDANAREILAEMSFPGISVVTAPARSYPGGSLAQSLLGRTVAGTDGPIGASGLEQVYNRVLRGTSGMEVSDNAVGVTIPGTQHMRTPRPGSDVELGLDEGIQYQAEQSLLDQVTAQNARAGMAVVLDLKTGDVLAMASVRGGAHPHVASSTDANLPLTYAYSPGSVMKIVAVSKAFDSGCITTNTTFQVPDHMMNGTFPLQDDETHPVETMRPWDIITMSSNVGTAMIAQNCFHVPSTMDAALRSFGFGHKTGIGFPGEARGLLLRPDQYGESGVISTAIGYSALVTPMQLLDAYAAIARGGVAIRPRLMRATIDANGVRHNAAVHVGARIVSSTTAETMRSIFENVVRAGTGVCASIPGYEVAGKTGTVRKLGAAGVYDPGGHFATFAGFAPATAPRLAAIVVLDDPSSTYGGQAAAPVFSEVMGAALLRMQIPAPAPMPGLPPQYAQAHYKHSCPAIPHGSALQQLLAERAYKAAHPTTTTSSTSTTSTTTAHKTKPTSHTHGPTTTTTHTTRATRPSTPTSTTTTARPAARAGVP